MATYNRGERLRELREARGMSLAAVGAEVGVTKAAVSKWERNKSPEISLEVFFKLADLYEIDPRDLAIGKKSASSALPMRRLALIQAYGRLPDEMRAHIRALIEALDVALTPRYQEWSRKEAARVRRRDDVVHDV
jgi:transcriptional regulator with XRE-family HTH domain